VPGMRHVGTLIAAIISAPLAWILLAYGQDRSVQAASVGRWRRWPRRVGETLGMDAADRPLGADGLGLTPPDRWTEPELAVRYTTRPRSAGPAEEV
jgi:hypothetical protein